MNASDRESIRALREQMQQIQTQLRVIADRNNAPRLDFANNKLLISMSWLDEELNNE